MSQEDLDAAPPGATPAAHAVSMWGESGPRPEPNHDLDELFATMVAEGSVAVAATPEASWDLVSDVTRIGEFSPECVEAWWSEDRPPRCVGARFEGRNRVVQGDTVLEWVRPCDVVAWEPMRLFAWTTGDKFDATPATSWAFEIEPDGDGIVLRQRFAHVPDGLSGIRVAAEEHLDVADQIVAARLAALHAGIAETLGRMQAVLEADALG